MVNHVFLPLRLLSLLLYEIVKALKEKATIASLAARDLPYQF